MDRRTYFQGEEVTPAELNGGFDGAENADRNAFIDLGFVGIMSGLTVAESAPAALTVQVGGPGAAYDQGGQRCYVPGTQTVDCSVDSNGASTAVAVAGNTKIVSVFIKFARANSDARTTTETPPQNVYFVNNESFAFYVVQGAEDAAPAAPALINDGILLADITRSYGQTQILNANISTSRRQDLTAVAGAPHSLTAGTVKQALAQLLGFINNHFAATQDRHAAADVDYAGGPNWADGSANAAGTVEATIDSIIARIAATSGNDGSMAIGCKTVVGTASGQPNMAGGTLSTVVQALRLASNLWYTAGPNWLDGATNPATDVQSQLTKIVTDLGDQVGVGADGAARIGAEARGVMARGSVGSQLSALETNKAALAGATFTGQVTFGGGFIPLLSGAAAENRHQALRIVGMQASTSATVSMVFTAPAIDTKAGLAAADSFLLDLSDIPDGATLVSVTVTTIALGANGSPSNPASYTIQRHDGVTVPQAMSADTADAHTYGGGGNWLTTNVDTTVNVTANATIDKSGYTYFLRVSSPYDPGIGAQMRVLRVIARFTRNTLKA